MRLAQLDENLSSRKLIDACNVSGGVKAVPLPIALRGKSDDTVFRELIPNGNLLVTNDVAMVEENFRFLDEHHPGILIVDQDDDAVATMTWKTCLRILHAFKQGFPQWETVPWENSIVLLRPSFIEVQHLAAQELIRNVFVDRSDPHWQTMVYDALVENSNL